MYFNSVTFGLFFAVVFVLYWALRDRRTPRHLLIVTASYVFYGWWDWRFLLLIFASTLLDFFVGWRLHEETDQGRRKRLLTLSLVGNLGFLAFFKYFNFFYDSLLMGLGSLGIELGASEQKLLRVALPPGISFYTFQTLSYSLDIYRRKMQPTKSFLDFAYFVAFFPQLVAGPILRASHFLPQMKDRMEVDARQHADGFYLILRGLTKKICFADILAAQMVDPVFGSALAGAGLPDAAIFSSMDVFLSAAAFTLMLYMDFSAYSDIAIGASQLMGFWIPDNFDSPLKAASLRELWRRWHISLASWMRDYLYISLGGNRVTTTRAYFNTIFTMTIMGLWHGAGWNFILLGFIQGWYLVFERMLNPLLPKYEQGTLKWWAQRWMGVGITLTFFILVNIFFRASTATQAWDLLFRIFEFDGPLRSQLFDLKLLALLAAALLLHWVPAGFTHFWRRAFIHSPVVVKAVVAAALFSAFSLLAGAQQPFIYFQF